MKRKSAAGALTSSFGLLGGLRLSRCGAITVKQDAVGSQIGDQCVQITRQLLIIQQGCDQTFPLHGAAQDLARVGDGVLQAIVLERGRTSRNKLIRIDGLSDEDVRCRLLSAV